jgi:hypothetical protein
MSNVPRGSPSGAPSQPSGAPALSYTHDNRIYSINPARIPIDMAKHGINYEQAVILQAIQQAARRQN